MSASTVRPRAHDYIGLVDVNARYVSADRDFAPSLIDRTVVILSNHGGCCVSLSDEANALGIPMGYPWFKLQAGAEKLGLVARTSNYKLYGDMSSRVMNHRLLREMQLAIIL